MFHVSQLKPFVRSASFPDRVTPRTDAYDVQHEAAGGGWYYVDSLVGVVRPRRGAVRYRVRWKGYGEDDDTLETAGHLTRKLGAKTFGEFLRKFEASQAAAQQGSAEAPARQRERRRRQ